MTLLISTQVKLIIEQAAPTKWDSLLYSAAFKHNWSYNLYLLMLNKFNTHTFNEFSETRRPRSPVKAEELVMTNAR